ncbi:aldose 1-epimerase family protein [Pedobacter montanisoli]|uniref:Aldose 1-epimerase family protein n=1 Tax=Pedobacter montanisoli TaxID=2923277 RepID=A0ABS9ZS87_9SPHI|nr:aldose 1-epimerase family protein [Pedobacter montanisoli]MCJ0741436.1 aldose 1-epimerase family protein [Pedobacter montanisoli]
MPITLSNKYLNAEFKLKGAELIRLKDIKNNRELLWNADSQYWGKHSPILFPIVGALKDDTYYYNDIVYKLPRHGFARDMNFTLLQQTETEVLLSLSATEETLEHYPFLFQLNVRYQLLEHTLICSYEIENPSQTPLLFSIGAHPAFAVPVNGQGTYEDYYLSFDEDKQLNCLNIKDNLITDELTIIALELGKLPLKHELFYNDALVLKDLKSKKIRLNNTKNEHGLCFSFEGFPYFGIWSAHDANFVCLEPWCGIADGKQHNQQLTDKEGIISLDGGGKWKRSWSVGCY